MAEPCTVAIVGGGFSGTMVAVQLLRGAATALRIVLIEREGPAGHGIAYREQPDCHLLNVRAGGMSALPERPTHFLDWYRTQVGPAAESDFLPRRRYGEYLESLLVQARAGTSAADFEFLQAEAIAVDAASDGRWQLRFDGRRTTVAADFVVLALGNPGPADPASAGGAMHDDPRYVARPWSHAAIEPVRAQDEVLLIGAGLTALDWVMALEARGHRGRVHLLSRRGLLPQAHAVVPVAAAAGFDPASLAPRVSAWTRALRAATKQAAREGRDWRGVIDALRPQLPDLWQRLPPAEQRRFLRHLRPYWEIHRHRAAPEVMAHVRHLRESGLLRVLAGRVRAIEPGRERLTVRIVQRGARTHSLAVDYVVNCTGPESRLRRFDSPLVRELLARGIVRLDALELGLDTDARGALRDHAGHVHGTLFTLGPLCKGTRWETTAVPEIRMQAAQLAAALLTRVPSVSGRG